MTLILARHGQTFSNVAHALDTQAPGADLTKTGQEQAVELADRLHDAGITKIVTSDLVRTQQTAAPLAQLLGIEPIIDERFTEVKAGDVEMRTDEDAYAIYMGTVKQWLSGKTTVRMPGGETGDEVLARFNAGLAEHCEGTTLVVAHGCVLMTWANLVADRGDVPFLAHMINCAHGIFDGTPEKWTLLSWPENPEFMAAVTSEPTQ